MILVDANVLVYAFRRDSDRHSDYRNWLIEVLNGDAAFGMSEQVLASVIRITTHPRIFRKPSSLAEAIVFVEAIRNHPLCRLIRPAERHWPLFARLCERSGAKANLVTDAWYAALAAESGCTWITADRDFARFPGLRWMHPLEHSTLVENPG